jgi:phosphodiesterase/alkaline phosphatase D-like protein
VLPTSASVAGTVDPHGTATKWYFEFGLSTNADFGSTSAVADTAATSGDDNVTATLAGLSPATSYHYRLVATNAGGTITCQRERVTGGSSDPVRHAHECRRQFRIELRRSRATKA